MHARIDQLLSRRDGEPVEATVRAHVDTCRECAANVAQLGRVRERLGALPAVEPQPGAWVAVRARLEARERSARRRVVASRLVAVASVAGLVLIAALFRDGGGDAIRAPGRATPLPGPGGGSVATLLDRSLELERALAAMPSRPIVERAETSIPIDALQARVRWIDHRLSEADAEGATSEDAEQLWRERVAVMSSLVRLRYVEAQRVAL